MKRSLTTTLSTFAIGLSICASPAFAQHEKPEKSQTEAAPAKPSKPAKQLAQKTVTKDASVTIAGKQIDYTVAASRITLKNTKDEPRASLFYVSYVKKEVKDAIKRPVLFAFNGGPGSSAVWLHLGALGPKIIPTSTDGTTPLMPPITVKDNPLSILDVADLVFIDPVSTGYSKIEKNGKPQEFHSVDGDISSVGDFIRRWITENKRWSSPKFILGESYGGVRAAGLASHLQSRYGMHLNGVVLLSSLLDFSTVKPSNGNDLAYITYLPALTATAHHHAVVKGDRDKLIAEANTFAYGEYATALLKGNKLPAADKNKIAAKIASLTGVSKQIILDNNLRLSSTRFRKELLRSKGMILGRFDARVSWNGISKSSNYPSYDPSFSVAKGAFSTAMLAYLGDDLGWIDEQPYEILTGKVHPWSWGANNRFVNVAPKLVDALAENPKLKILVQCGHTDLATPAGGILHSINHLDLPKALRDNISVAWYDAGHMFYLNQPDLVKCRKDLVNFITSATKAP